MVDVVKNPLRLPWKVVYDNDWNGSEYVDRIIDCQELDVIDIYNDTWPVTKEQAEAIVCAMNAHFRSQYE
jgi:hypothetical protein